MVHYPRNPAAKPPEDGFVSAESPWRGERYDILYVDPPWKYNNWTDAKNGAAAAHYEGMKYEDLVNLRIDRYAKDDSLMVMWATWPKLQEAMDLGNAWGFRHITGFPWIKYVPSYADAVSVVDPKTGVQYFHVKQGCGFVVYACSELVLIWKKGNPKRGTSFTKQVGLLHDGYGSQAEKERNETTEERLLFGCREKSFWAPIRGHSKKPAEIRWQLASEYPEADKLELFATGIAEVPAGHKPWTQWGNMLGTVLTPDGVYYEDRTLQGRLDRFADSDFAGVRAYELSLPNPHPTLDRDVADNASGLPLRHSGVA